MSYYFTKTLNLSFDKAFAQLAEELKKEGFGVLTNIVHPEAKQAINARLLRLKNG